MQTNTVNFKESIMMFGSKWKAVQAAEGEEVFPKIKPSCDKIPVLQRDV